MYNPKPSFQVNNECAPTYFDKVWRSMLCRCVIEDPTSYIFGGTAGNAGIFSTA
jgi:hypothetical protein